jgi:hypothetical protein
VVSPEYDRFIYALQDFAYNRQYWSFVKVIIGKDLNEVDCLKNCRDEIKEFLKMRWEIGEIFSHHNATVMWEDYVRDEIEISMLNDMQIGTIDRYGKWEKLEEKTIETLETVY